MGELKDEKRRPLSITLPIMWPCTDSNVIVGVTGAPSPFPLMPFPLMMVAMDSTTAHSSADKL